MDGFLSNTWANLVGTFVGAALAIFAARRAERRHRRSTDVNELQRVIDRLADARALTKFPKSRPRTHPLSASAQEDEARVRLSVLNLRQMLADALHNISKDDPSLGHLRDMQGACSRYMNYVEVYPSDYENAVQHLRDTVLIGLHAIVAINRRLELREPGSSSSQLPQLGTY